MAGPVILGLSGLGALNGNVHASSYFSSDTGHATYTRRNYVRKPIKLEQMNNSSVFADVRPVGSKWLHKNESVGVVLFYHMGHDGYIVHVPGKRAIYYAPTNSHSWFGKKIVKHHQQPFTEQPKGLRSQER